MFSEKIHKAVSFFAPFQPKYKLQKNRPSFLAVTISMTHSSRGKMDPKINLSLPSSPSMYISRFLGSPHLEAKQRNSLFWGQHNDPVRFRDREEERRASSTISMPREEELEFMVSRIGRKKGGKGSMGQLGSIGERPTKKHGQTSN